MNKFPSASPSASRDLLVPNEALHQTARKVLTRVILFSISYFILVILSVALVVLAFAVAAIMMSRIINGYTVLISLGSISLSIMIFVLLIKFIFGSGPKPSAVQQEVHAKNYPMLFEFIQQVAKEVGTQVPKKVFLIPDVNASVFYHRRSLSVVFDSRKNLNVGLGLIHALTVDEFKAVLAHEFGHFSQKSMRMGTYVQGVHRVVSSILFQHDRVDQFILDWANGSTSFALFGRATWSFANAIRRLIEGMYHNVRRSYSKLSLEMEFHADQVAAWATDANIMGSALQKIELAASADQFLRILLSDFAEKEGKKPDNYYDYFDWAMRQLVAINQGTVYRKGWVFDDEDVASMSDSKLVIENVWESHPTLEQRLANLEKATHQGHENLASAWEVVDHLEGVKKNMTQKLFREVSIKKELQAVPVADFVAWYQATSHDTMLKEPFFSYYRIRKQNEIPEGVDGPAPSLLTLLDTEHKQRIAEVITLAVDIGRLEELYINGGSGRYFEYDRQVYKRQVAGKLIDELRAKFEQENEWLKNQDYAVIQAGYAVCKEAGLDKEYQEVCEALHQVNLNQRYLGPIWDRFNGYFAYLKHMGYLGEDQQRRLAFELYQEETRFMNALMALDLSTYHASFTEEERSTYERLVTEQRHLLSDTYFGGEAFHRLVGLLSKIINLTDDRWTEGMLAWQGLLEQAGVETTPVPLAEPHQQ